MPSVNSGVERLDAEPLAQIRVARARSPTGRCPVPKRRGSTKTQPVAARRARSATRVCGGSPGGIEQQRAGHPQVHQQVTSPESSQTRYLPRAAELLDPPRRAAPAHLRGGSGARPARIEDLDRDDRPPPRCGRELAADRLDLGKLRHPVYMNGAPGQLAVVASPASQRSTLAPTSASGPSWRRPPWPAKRASSGACSRVWSVVRRRRVAAVVGGQDQQVIRPQQRQPARDARVDPSQRAGEALEVLAVAVDLIGLDQVREHEPGSSSPISSVVARAPRVGRARMLDVDPDAGEQLPDLADRVDLDRRLPAELRDSSASAAASAKSRRPSVRSKAPSGPANGRAITRPTACSGGSVGAHLGAALVQLGGSARRRRARRSAAPSPGSCRRSASPAREVL